MHKAIWNGMVIAESDQCEFVDGNAYFPPDSVKWDNLQESETRTVCPWKGEARYYSVVAGEQVNADAAWVYPQTKEAAKNIEGYFAFWKGVEVES